MVIRSQFLDQGATNFVANYIPDFGCHLLKPEDNFSQFRLLHLLKISWKVCFGTRNDLPAKLITPSIPTQSLVKEK